MERAVEKTKQRKTEKINMCICMYAMYNKRQGCINKLGWDEAPFAPPPHMMENNLLWERIEIKRLTSDGKRMHFQTNTRKLYKSKNLIRIYVGLTTKKRNRQRLHYLNLLRKTIKKSKFKKKRLTSVFLLHKQRKNIHSSCLRFGRNVFEISYI